MMRATSFICLLNPPTILFLADAGSVDQTIRFLVTLDQTYTVDDDAGY